MLELRTVNKLSMQKVLNIVTGLKQNCSYNIRFIHATGKSGLEFILSTDLI